MRENLRCGVSKRSSVVAAFGIELGAIKTGQHLAGGVAGVHRSARVALLLREMKMPLQAGDLFEAALTSSAWALTSCTQIQSGRCADSHFSSPLVVAERMPLRLRLVSLNKDVPWVLQAGAAQAVAPDALAQEFVQFCVDARRVEVR